MKPVDQTTFGGPGAPLDKRGDCFSAALASVLEIPLSAVPRFCELPRESDWTSAINDFLRGYDLAYLEFEMHPDQTVAVLPGLGFHLISGAGPRGGTPHTVVGHQGGVVFDPHPSKAGITSDKPWRYGVLISRVTRPPVPEHVALAKGYGCGCTLCRAAR